MLGPGGPFLSCGLSTIGGVPKGELPPLDQPANWIAEALIVAPALPSDAVAIGDCEIHPIQMTWSERQESMQMMGSGPGLYTTLIPEPAHLRFSASHRISTTISDVTLETARNIAVQRFGRVATLTFLLVGHIGFAPEAAIRLVSIAPADDPSNRVGDLVESRGGIMPIMSMDAGLLNEVAAKYRAAKTDLLLGRLIDIWHEADLRVGLAFIVHVPRQCLGFRMVLVPLLQILIAEFLGPTENRIAFGLGMGVLRRVG